ncbi:MAG: sigma-70 family RNA polymerase sigma factor [Candidatus Bathyarchaeota archaeon]|nr:MAG: sigma-70 family RNA polymerase sigma factor [Candidatus Bathyarchaeota archaeon]
MALPDTSKCQCDVDHAAEIFAEYGGFIRAIIHSQVKSETQADDMFQDFFLSLVCKPVPQNVKNIKGYLYRAITNDIIDSVRRVERYRNHMHKYSKHLDHPINKRTPEDAFICVEETNKMFELIKGRIRNNEFQAITLQYKSHYSIKNVAKIMGVKCKSVREYTSRGLGRIRQSLKLK